MSLATIAYAPVLDKLHPQAFLENIRHWKTKHPVIWFTDYKKYDFAIKVDSPDVLRRSVNKVAIQNCLFMFALRIAKEHGIKRFIYLESDCRVRGDNWDEALFSEADHHTDAFVSGTPTLWNTAHMNGDVLPEVRNYIQEYTSSTGWKVAEFRPRKNPRQSTPCIFIMGAGGIYSTAPMMDIFGYMMGSPGHAACRIPPFDLHIGTQVFKLFGKNGTKKLPWLSRQLSTFGDKMMTYQQRKDALLSGRAVLIHQIKSDEALI